MIQIVMLSGGADSTALLFHNLLFPQPEFLHAHHIRLINVEDRHKEEDEATKKIITVARELYPRLGFSCSTFQFPDFGIGFTGLDLLTVAHIGSMVTRAIQNQFLFAENILYDAQLEIAGNYTEVGPDWNSNTRKIQADHIFEDNFYDYKQENKTIPRITYPLAHISKTDMLKIIPEDILPHISSCRNPAKIGDLSVSCGMCHSCVKLQNAEIEYKEVKSNEK